MRRRAFLALLSGGIATLASQAVRAQQQAKTRRIGVLMGISESDPDAAPRIMVLRDALQQSGWQIGHTLVFDLRWSRGDVRSATQLARELVSRAPDVLIADGTPALRALQQATSTIPIIFTVVSEPVAAGFVRSLARPGGNITGFSNLQASVGEKWVEILKELAPGVSRVALLYNPETTPPSQQDPRWARAAGHRLGVTVTQAPARTPEEIQSILDGVAREHNSALILPQDPFTSVHRRLIIDLAAQHRVAAIFAFRYFPESGGLASYGVNIREQYRQAGGYADRILRGESAADLPVQQPTKLELVINLRTAGALGLSVPPILLARTDEVIE
jgi:putative ABC transport system substrate-binding protein